MKAGRDLDALVAEKVMGLYRLHDSKASDVGPTSASNFKASGHYGPLYRTPDGSATLILPEYSTDIAAAWQVVEFFNRTMPDTWSFQLYGGKRDWHCEIDSNDGRFLQNGSNVLVCRHGESAPLAVCLAALEAIGVSV